MEIKICAFGSRPFSRFPPSHDATCPFRGGTIYRTSRTLGHGVCVRPLRGGQAPHNYRISAGNLRIRFFDAERP